jgi:hypothetical protein
LGLGVRSVALAGGFSGVVLAVLDCVRPLRTGGGSALGVDTSGWGPWLSEGPGCGSLPSLIAGLLGGRPPPLPPRVPPRAPPRPLPLIPPKVEPGSALRGLLQSRGRDEGWAEGFALLGGVLVVGVAINGP